MKTNYKILEQVNGSLLKSHEAYQAELNPYLAPFPNPPPLRQSSELDADKSQVFHPFPP